MNINLILLLNHELWCITLKYLGGMNELETSDEYY
jgi:hypothetical protein